MAASALARHLGITRRALLQIGLLTGAITLGRPLPASPQEMQIFAAAGAGAQLACQESGDPTRLDYEVEFSLGGLLTIARSGLALGVQGDICDHDGLPDVRLGPVVEYRMPFQHWRLQPFAKVGYFGNNLAGAYGERAVIGAGIDFLRADGADVRVSVQDAFRQAVWLDERVNCRPCSVPMRPTAWFRHEVSFHIGLIWK